jgi:hypothetical protein
VTETAVAAEEIRNDIDLLLEKIDAAASASVVSDLGKLLDHKIDQLQDAEAVEEAESQLDRPSSVS